MTTNAQRLQFVNAFLQSLGNLKPLAANTRSELVFEIYCYFRKVDELISSGKAPQPHNVISGVFNPNSKPGNPISKSYISFQVATGGTFDLFLNGEFPGKSGVRHSPDIVLRETQSHKVLSIYECKNRSRTLGLNYCREFIGYLEELGIPRHGYNAVSRNFNPETRPCVYTSAVASPADNQIAHRYDFDIIDRL